MHALRGITRNVVIKNAQKLGYTVITEEITPADLFLSDEVFFTGTAAEIHPVTEINRRKIRNGKPGPITRKLMREYQKLTPDPQEGVLIY